MRLNPFGLVGKSDQSKRDSYKSGGKIRFIRIEMDTDKIDLIPLKTIDIAPIIDTTRSLGLNHNIKSRKTLSIKGIWLWAWWRIRHIRRPSNDKNIPFDWVFTRKLWTRTILYPPISFYRLDNMKIFDVLSDSCREMEGNVIDFERFARKVLDAYYTVLPLKEAMGWARTYSQ